MFEKRKIKAFLQSPVEKDAFFYLISDYASGALKEKLKSMAFKSINFELEWGEYCKRITISAKNENSLYLFATADTKNEHFLSLTFESNPEPKRITPPKSLLDAEYFYHEIKMLIKTFEYLD